MLDKIHLNNSKMLIILVIVVLILFAIVYVCMNRDIFGKEKFTNYPVEVGDLVQLQGGFNNVQVGGELLETSINRLIQQKFDNFNSQILQKFQHMQQLLDYAVPTLSIVSFYGTIAPTGWQLCNGADLQAMDNRTVYNNSGTIIKTPNLQGRTIVGTNTSSGAKPDGSKPLSLYNIGDYGGEEKHTLTIQEMPSHNHISGATTGYVIGNSTGGLRGNIYQPGQPESSVAFSGGNSGGNAPHYNMQPYYVLSYIIKKPELGGLEHPLSIVLPTNGPSIDKPKI